MSRSAFSIRFSDSSRKLTEAQRHERQAKLNKLADERLAKLALEAGGAKTKSVDEISSEGVRTIKGMVTRKSGHLYIVDGRGDPLRLLVRSGTVLAPDTHHARERLAIGWGSAAKNRAINEAVTHGLARILELLDTQREVHAEVSGYVAQNPVGTREFRASRIVV